MKKYLVVIVAILALLISAGTVWSQFPTRDVFANYLYVSGQAQFNANVPVRNYGYYWQTYNYNYADAFRVDYHGVGHYIMNLQANGSDILTLNKAGDMGFGAAPTVGKLHLEQTNITSPVGYRSAAFIKQNVNPTVNHAANSYMYALIGYGFVPLASSNTINRVVGVQGWAENYGSGSVARLVGTSAWAYNDKDVTVTDIWGTSNVATSNAGTVSSLIGERLFVSSYGGSITDNIGLHIDDVLISGSTVANRYGIKIDTFTGSPTTLDYAFYSSATQDSYFAGRTGFGTASPAAKLTTKAFSTVGSATQTGGGLDDLTSGGTFTGGLALDYDVYIDQTDATSTVDTIGQPTGALVNGGYTGVATVKTGGGGDDNLTVDVTVAGGIVTVITVNVGGNGYAVNDTITLTGLSGAGGGGNDDGTFDVASVVDTVKWSDDDGATWDVEKVEITGAAQTLNNGVTVTFGAVVGHTVTDYWEFSTTVIQSFLAEDESGNDIVTILNDGTIRSIHTVDTHYTDFQTDGSGDLTITPSGGDSIFNSNVEIPSNTDGILLAADSSTSFYSDILSGTTTATNLIASGQTNHSLELISDATKFRMLANQSVGRCYFQASETGTENSGELFFSGWTTNPADIIEFIGHTIITDTISLAAPSVQLEVVEPSGAQIRATHTIDTHYTDFQTDGSGDLTITPSGDEVDITQDAVSTTLDISAYHDTGTTTPTITMRKADNTKASPAPVDQNDILGTINFNGYDDDSFDNGARIYAKADANWGAAERGAELYFSTRDGAGGLTDQYKILANGDFNATTSKWWFCKYIDVLNLASGGSGATQTYPDANTLGGYQLDAIDEYLYFNARACPNWDEASDPELAVTFEVNVNNAGGLVTDTVDFSLLCYYKGVGETANKSQTATGSVVVGQSAQFNQFVAMIPIDHDIGGGNDVDVRDVFAFRINLDTGASEVDNVIVNFFMYHQQGFKVQMQTSESP